MEGQRCWQGGHRKGRNPQRSQPATESPGWMDIGHITSMPCRPTWLLKQLLYRERFQGKCLVKGQIKSFKDLPWSGRSTSVLGSHLPRTVQLGIAKSPKGPVQAKSRATAEETRRAQSYQCPPPLQLPHTQVSCRVAEPSWLILLYWSSLNLPH